MDTVYRNTLWRRGGGVFVKGKRAIGCTPMKYFDAGAAMYALCVYLCRSLVSLILYFAVAFCRVNHFC